MTYNINNAAEFQTVAVVNVAGDCFVRHYDHRCCADYD